MFRRIQNHPLSGEAGSFRRQGTNEEMPHTTQATQEIALSGAGHRANMEYARQTGNHRLYSDSWDAINLPRVNAAISRWNSAMREISADQERKMKKMD